MKKSLTKHVRQLTPVAAVLALLALSLTHTPSPREFPRETPGARPRSEHLTPNDVRRDDRLDARARNSRGLRLDPRGIYDGLQQPQVAEESESEGEDRPDRPDEAARWRMLQMVDEYGNIPEGALVNAWEQKKQVPVESRAWPVGNSSGVDEGEALVAGISRTGWTWLGPGNIGGRIRSILISPSSPSTMWVGSVGGGIWKTNDGGATWAALDDFMANLAVNTMAIDPANPNVLYAGTGEGFLAGNNEDFADVARGAGVFKTNDGGASWAQLSSTNNASWYYVNRVAVSPRNSQVLLAATQSGIWRSPDGGASWSRRTSSNTQDVNFSPRVPGGCVASGIGGALYSTDDGQTWGAASGLPVGGRVEVAYFPLGLVAGQIVDIVYASVDVNNGEVYRSNNGGQSYARMSTGFNYLTSTPGRPGQGFYDNIIWVDPTSADIVVVGGIDLWRSIDSGRNFTRISNWRNSPQTPHADHHAIVESPQFNGTTNKVVFFGNDGGIYRANDVYAASTTAGWTELNNNLGITQFYGGAGNATSGRIIGGTQDNSTLVYTGGPELPVR
jgi:photosystem II stability/assembly factor-like uncharacterized protein